MSDTVLENTKTRKLIFLSSGAVLLTIACFFLGGFLAPCPNIVEVVSGLKCQASSKHDKWHIPRGEDGRRVNCDVELNDTKDVVFAFQVPVRFKNDQRTFSRWMQRFAALAYFNVVYENNDTSPFLLTFEVKLGYRDINDPADNWTSLASSFEQRELYCHPYQKVLNISLWECEAIPLFQLDSVHHDYYLINIYPSAYISEHHIKNRTADIDDAMVTTITQDEMYTKLFLALKTAFFFIIVIDLIWFWRRILQLSRPSLLYERLLLSLGTTLSLLNLPLEFLTLWIEVPFMKIISCICLDSFLLYLLGFWLIFFGEHLGCSQRNRLSLYWPQILAVMFGCLPVFCYGLYDQVLPLVKPFSEVKITLNIAFFILSGILSFVYLAVLCFVVFSVYRKVDFKISCLPNMLGALTLGYSKTMKRVKFLLISSLVCACLTFASFLAIQVVEKWWKFGWHVAFLKLSPLTLGTYAIWNTYIFVILILYAPSRRFREQSYISQESSSYVVSEHFEEENS